MHKSVAAIIFSADVSKKKWTVFNSHPHKRKFKKTFSSSSPEKPHHL